MMKNYLAIDIGTSGGKAYIGNADLWQTPEQIFYFANSPQNDFMSSTWDVDVLQSGVLGALKACAEKGICPESVAIDTWGVDYVLLDRHKNVITPVYTYKDPRTTQASFGVHGIISQSDMYERIGILHQGFNTVYQLYADCMEGRLDEAEYFLMMPDYLNFCLTGEIKQEFTNACTTGLVNAKTRDWDRELIDMLGLPQKLFLKLEMPGTTVGNFLPEIEKQTGYGCSVVLSPSHNVASSLNSLSLEKNDIFMLTGVWSMIGFKSDEPILREECFRKEYTNEGLADGKFAFYKNVLGSFPIELLKMSLGRRGINATDEDLDRMALTSGCRYYISINDRMFSNPRDMFKAVRMYLGHDELTDDDVVRIVYRSLASAYMNVIEDIERICGKTFERIWVSGPGTDSKVLNGFIEDITHRKVMAGCKNPAPAGNIKSQVRS